MTDPTIDPPDRPLAFSKWVSGYYTHGTSADALERRTPAASPPPTITTMSPADVAASFVPEPAAPPGGSDVALLGAGIGTGLNGVMRRRAFYLGLHDFDVDFEGEGGKSDTGRVGG